MLRFCSAILKSLALNKFLAMQLVGRSVTCPLLCLYFFPDLLCSKSLSMHCEFDYDKLHKCYESPLKEVIVLEEITNISLT